MKSWKFITYNQLGKQSDVCRECVKVHEDDTHIIGCLCDGLGSPENAQIAAEVATDTVIEMFSTIQSSGDITKNDVRQVKEAVVTAVKTRLKKTAEEKKLELDALDCTLLFVCVFKEEDIAVIGNLGESALCVIGNTDARLFGNGTLDGKAVLDDNAVQRLYMTIIRLDDNVKGFLLSSDGLESEVYYKGQEYVGKSAEIYFNVVLEEDPQKAMQEKVAELTDDPEAGFNDDISLTPIRSMRMCAPSAAENLPFCIRMSTSAAARRGSSAACSSTPPREISSQPHCAEMTRRRPSRRPR